jgi:hypothetical protein
MTPPTEFTDDLRRVYHGGGWSSPFATYMRVVRRRSMEPSDRDSHLGFRTTQCGCRLPLKG